MKNQLLKIKKRLEINNNIEDDLLNQIIEDAEVEVLDYTNRKEIAPEMEGIVREVAIIIYNRLHSEGEASRSEGGVSVSYELPENIKKRLSSFKMHKFWRIANEK